MKTLRRLFLLITVPLVALLTMAFIPKPGEDACITEVRELFKELNAQVQPAAGKHNVFYMRYTMRTVTADSAKDGVISSNVEMLANGNNIEVKSADAILYQDGKDAFMVLPKRKLIMRSDADHKNMQSDRHRARLELLQDTVFSFCTVEKCGNLANGDKQVELVLNQKGKDLLGLGRILFVYSPVTKLFKKVRIQYAPYSRNLPGEVKWIEYSFQEISYDYKKKKPSASVEKLFMSGGKLVSAYAGYQLIDNRYRKNPIDKNHERP